MEIEAIRQEINSLIILLGDEIRIAKPDTERTVIEQIRLILDRTREQRTGSSRDIWHYYLPYAAKLCSRLCKFEEGWENDLDYFAIENAQFWLDNSTSFLEEGNITEAQNALGQIIEATRMVKRDFIMRVDILLQALDIALEISDKKQSIQLYEESEKIYRKHLAGGEQYTGSTWLPKIKKLGHQLTKYREKLRRYYHHAEAITVSLEADTEGDLERVIDYLQLSLIGKIKITRRVKETEGQGKSSGFRARLKITLE